MNDVIVESERDRRILIWLVSQVGEQSVRQAVLSLPGARKPYVSNIAKALGLMPPAHLNATEKEVAKRHIAVLKDMLASKKGVT